MMWTLLYQIVTEINSPLRSIFDVLAIKKSPTPPIYYGPPEGSVRRPSHERGEGGGAVGECNQCKAE
jgi:hypothetical protein